MTTCQSTGSLTHTCVRENLTALLDLCGICLGDFSTCFFASIEPNSAGIAGGVMPASWWLPSWPLC